MIHAVKWNEQGVPCDANDQPIPKLLPQHDLDERNTLGRYEITDKGREAIAGAALDMREVTVDTFRAGFAPGAVRVTHRPSGKTASWVGETTERQNREYALSMLDRLVNGR